MGSSYSVAPGGASAAGQFDQARAYIDHECPPTARAAAEAELKERGEIPHGLPVFLDSPMAVHTTELLPRAFPKAVNVPVWITPDGLVVIGSTSTNAVDTVITMLVCLQLIAGRGRAGERRPGAGRPGAGREPAGHQRAQGLCRNEGMGQDKGSDD